MFVVFHQNMLLFNGRKVVRNQAYIRQMGKIRARIGPYTAVAGYTELLNAGPGMHKNLPAIAQALEAGLTSHLIIEVGTTAVGVRPEYIGIAWDPRSLAVDHAGQVVWDSMEKKWSADDTEEKKFPKDRTLALTIDVHLGVDQRGLAYIACRRVRQNDEPFIIAFLHNMYSVGDRSRAVAGMDDMTDLAKKSAGPVYANAEVIVGGDFNVEPPDSPPAGGPRRKSARFNLTTRVARDRKGNPLNTTRWHPYDYWKVSDFRGISDNDAKLHTETRWDRDEECSDHAGVTVVRS